MNKINKFIITTHRILGTLLSAVFLMWFLTGIVMLYHGRFPRADKAEKMELLSSTGATADLPPIDSLTHQMAYSSLYMDRYLGQTIFHISSPDTLIEVTPLGQPQAVTVNDDYLDKVAAYWCKAEVKSVDTLRALDQWVPFGRLEAELPILKYNFADDEAHELYIGSNTGNVLQYTTREQRVWAWLGPIPHWVYFTWLRTNQDAWMNTVIWMSGIGCLMVITGIWAGVTVWLRTRKNKKVRFSPYKKKWYHWHYVTGFVFGLFCLTYVFSGMMSLTKNPPAFISESKLDFDVQRELMSMPADSFTLDYRKVLAAQPEATNLEWKHIGNIPFYTVRTKDGGTINYDGRHASCTELNLSESDILASVKSLYARHGVDVSGATVEQLNSHELYSRMRGGDNAQMPIVKIPMNDADNGVFYINPSSGSAKYVDTSGRWAYWLYPGLHKLGLPGIADVEWLRITISLLILIGGAAISLTGVVLGCRYIKRTIFKKSPSQK